MPSNHILINNVIECFVSDSKMDDFLDWLDQNAYGQRKITTNDSGANKVAVINASNSQTES